MPCHLPFRSSLFACALVLAAPFAAFSQTSPQSNLVTASRAQIGKTTSYDPAYRKLPYPNGDVPLETGVCTDVVIRAMRSGLGLDLQKAVHEDMAANFSSYPKNWGLKAPDRNIDHRRVPNLQTYFKRRGWELALTTSPKDFQPGDIVTCTVPPNRPHIMIVSDKCLSDGTPLVIHNIGSGTKEENSLFSFKLTGHYRPQIQARTN